MTLKYNYSEKTSEHGALVVSVIALQLWGRGFGSC